MKKLIILAALIIVAFFIIKLAISQSEINAEISDSGENTIVNENTAKSDTPTSATDLAVATFAGGCFWCIESTFEKLDGVHEAVSGYSGGTTDNPTYREVGSGTTGHTETVQIFYDPEVISYEALLYSFWRDIDPTDSNGQFVDRGSEYRPAIFYHTETEREKAIKSRNELDVSNRFSKPITVEIIPFEKFYDAEEHHQDYHEKNALRYKVYRTGSGRDQFLEKVWGEDLHKKYEMPSTTTSQSDGAATKYQKPDDEILRQTLSQLQYDVTQNEATERPFSNEYWNNKEDGIYVDIVSGEPLFSSTAKFESKSGWPSFWEPIDKEFVVEIADYKLIFPRTELKSKYGQSHLGHVFNDGPNPTGLRYCINSASLKFIKKDDLVTQGYQDYQALFENN